MRSTRIIYEFDGPIGISKQVFRINGKDLRIVVDKENFYFEIVDNQGNPIKKGGNTKNYNVLLRQAKHAISRMGYEFGIEKRDRGGLDYRKQDS